MNGCQFGGEENDENNKHLSSHQELLHVVGLVGLLAQLVGSRVWVSVGLRVLSLKFHQSHLVTMLDPAWTGRVLPEDPPSRPARTGGRGRGGGRPSQGWSARSLSSARWWRRRWRRGRRWGGERCTQTGDSPDISPQIWRPWLWRLYKGSLSSLSSQPSRLRWSEVKLSLLNCLITAGVERLWCNKAGANYYQLFSSWMVRHRRAQCSPCWLLTVTVPNKTFNEGTKDANNISLIL